MVCHTLLPDDLQKLTNYPYIEHIIPFNWATVRKLDFSTLPDETQTGIAFFHQIIIAVALRYLQRHHRGRK
jgi:hypothetical protein